MEEALPKYMKKCREEVDIYSKEQFELYMEIVEGVVQLLLQKPEKDSSYGDLHKYISSLEKYLKDLVKVHNSQASSEQDGNCSYPLPIYHTFLMEMCSLCQESGPNGATVPVNVE